MSKDKFTKILNEPKTSLSEERIKDIRKKSNKSWDRFLNVGIKKLEKIIYEIENKKESL